MDKLKKLLQQKDRENYVEKEIEDVYNTVAKETGRTPEEIAQIGGVESQHGKYSKNMAGSRAKGLFQLMPQTIKYFTPDGSPESLTTQEEAMIKLLNENQQKLGKDSSIEDLYLLHNQGLGKGKKLILAPEEERIENILPKKIIKANPRLYQNKSVGEAKESIKQMLKERGEDFDFRTKIEDLFTKDQLPLEKKQEMTLTEEDTNLLNELFHYLTGGRDQRIQEKQNELQKKEEDDFFEKLNQVKKEKAEKVKKKYGGEI